MELQILVSTMHQQGFDLLKKMNIQSEAIVINQCNDGSIHNVNLDNFQVKWINSTERGLSRSRNMALKNATADICVLADDDLEYITNYKNVILEQFELYTVADVIAFQVEGIERRFKKYFTKPKKVNYLSSMKISSVEIAFRKSSIIEKGIYFNELLGAGAKYYSGEESAFLFDCLKKGIVILYVPEKIADLHLGNSNWFNGFSKDYFIAKGAVFTAMSRTFSLFFIFQFAFRKHKVYGNEITMKNAMKFMLEGRKEYKKEIF